MPCPACKVIIDGGYRVTQVLNCMSVTVLLNADNIERRPTKELEDEFLKAAEALAKVAAKVEKHASGA